MQVIVFDVSLCIHLFYNRDKKYKSKHIINLKTNSLWRKILLLLSGCRNSFLYHTGEQIYRFFKNFHLFWWKIILHRENVKEEELVRAVVKNNETPQEHEGRYMKERIVYKK